MFGLGWMELAIIGGVIMMIAGPAALPKLIEAARSVHKLKSDLTGGTGLANLLDVDETIASIADEIDPEEPPDDGPSP